MAEILKKVDQVVFSYFYNQLLNKVSSEVSDCDSILDIGCGYMPSIKKITDKVRHSVGMDAFQPSIDKAREAKTHSDYIVGDVLIELEKVADKSFDAVMALDLIEHLDKEKGFWLIEQMQRIAKKQVIIFTPNGFVPQRPYENNPWQEHKSGWSWLEMKKLGFQVWGFGGYKSLRGERFSLKYKPRVLWKVISFGTQLFVHKRPDLAYGILCIKKFNKK